MIVAQAFQEKTTDDDKFAWVPFMNEARAVSDGRIDLDVSRRVGWIRIDNPARRNALTLEMWRALPEAVGRLVRDAGVRAIAVTGADDGPFASGADISEFPCARATPDRGAVYESAIAAAFAALRLADKPTVAVIRSFCIGGGVGLAAACDVRLAAADAVFAIPAGRLGLAYPVDAVGDLVRLIGPGRTADIVFTARRLTAEEALRIGLLDHVAPPDDFAREVGAYFEQVTTQAPLTLRALKTAMLAVRSGAAPDADRATRLALDCLGSTDHGEGVRAFLENRKPIFSGR
jgi:enoyl-CoA hydratase/carnithine racemase